jgi:hypothetical protein
MALRDPEATIGKAGSSILSWTLWHGHAVASELPTPSLLDSQFDCLSTRNRTPMMAGSMWLPQSMARRTHGLQVLVKRRSITARAMAWTYVTRPTRSPRRATRPISAPSFFFYPRCRLARFATLELCLAHPSVSHDPRSFYHPVRVSPHICLIKAVRNSQTTLQQRFLHP